MSASALSSRAIIGSFYRRLKQNSGLKWVEAISNYFQSDQDSETYNWLGQVPVMREWAGGRQAKGFTTNGLTIENKHFEATLEVPVKDLLRDKTGQTRIRINELADRTNSHWAQLLSKLIVNGESTVCYDGQYFFDTDHEEGKSGQQSNKITYTGETGETSLKEDLFRRAMLKGVESILSYKDDQGEPFNEDASRFLIMVPTVMWHVAKSAIAVPLAVGGGTNPIKVLDELDITLVQNPRLTGWENKFVVFRCDSSVQAFIRQEEKDVEIQAIAEGSELEFKEGKHWYGVDTWRNVGYGYWQNTCLVSIELAGD